LFDPGKALPVGGVTVLSLYLLNTPSLQRTLKSAQALKSLPSRANEALRPWAWIVHCIVFLL
jgi:hypothetical protein